MKIRTSCWAAGVALAALGLAVGQLRAAPEVTTVRPGVYFFKNKNGVWISTFLKDGTGYTDARLTHDGVVDMDFYQFEWSMKGREIVRVRITNPESQIVERDLLLPDGSIQPYRTYMKGKLVSQRPKDIGTLEYLGKPGYPNLE